ncbi:MAG: hypothetical protein LH480_09840 [Rubrivivax sp.]|nr:hypothetical protein [Rubrivivax sp.]
MLFLLQFTAYVLLLGLATLAQSGLLKALANVYAVVIFGLVAFAWMTREPPPSRWATAVAVCLLVYLTGMVCSVIVNPDAIAWGDLIKMAMAPGFLIFGAAFQRARLAAGPAAVNRATDSATNSDTNPAGGIPSLWQRPLVRALFALLIIVPLATWAAQLAQSGLRLDGAAETSIFANRNNAAVYAVTMLALLAVLRDQPLRSMLVFVAVGVMFGTLGVMLAVLLALMLTVGRARELLVLLVLLAIGVAGYTLAPTFGPFARVTPLVDSVRLLLEGRINLHTATFGELVLMLKTQDLSFLFRLKHWLDLLYTFVQGDMYHWLFGWGVGSSTRLSDMGLVPHNDYLRVLFEFGLVTLAGFIGMLALILLRCGRRWETVPLLAVVIYLFSENLINNYIAISFFYFAAGALAERVGATATAMKAVPSNVDKRTKPRTFVAPWVTAR